MKTRSPRPGGVLIVIAGLPGSGKTTLLRRLLPHDIPGATGLDSEQVTGRLREAGLQLPYRLLRLWVHFWHRCRVLWRIRHATPVLLTDPWTSTGWRIAVLTAARCAHRSVRLVLIDASPELAKSGQAARGRLLSARAMRRHTVRWAGLLQAVARGAGGTGIEHAVIVNREPPSCLRGFLLTQ